MYFNLFKGNKNTIASFYYCVLYYTGELVYVYVFLLTAIEGAKIYIKIFKVN